MQKSSCFIAEEIVMKVEQHGFARYSLPCSNAGLSVLVIQQSEVVPRKEKPFVLKTKGFFMLLYKKKEKYVALFYSKNLRFS